MCNDLKIKYSIKPCYYATLLVSADTLSDLEALQVQQQTHSAAMDKRSAHAAETTDSRDVSAVAVSNAYMSQVRYLMWSAAYQVAIWALLLSVMYLLTQLYHRNNQNGACSANAGFLVRITS